MARLRALLGEQVPLLVPDAHDVLTAKLVERAGFPAVYVGSLGLSATQIGVPDQSLVPVSRLVEQARLVADAVDIPVVLDLEEGGGNAVTTVHNVRAAERSGVSAVQIEDHVAGKAYGSGGQLHDVTVAAEKIRAASEGRSDSDTIVIGRTETMLLGGSLTEAMDRCGAYVEAGAELVTASMLPTDEVTAFAKAVGAPVANWVFGETAGELQVEGLAIAIYAGQSTAVSYRAVSDWLAVVANGGQGNPAEDLWATIGEMNGLLGADINGELAVKHGVVGDDTP